MWLLTHTNEKYNKNKGGKDMKTARDLKIMYNSEFGEYPANVYDYVAWLEDKVLVELNKGFTVTKPDHPFDESLYKKSLYKNTEAERQTEALGHTTGPWEP